MEATAVFPPWYAKTAGIILKLRCKLCIMELELYNSVSKTVFNRKTKRRQKNED